MAASNVRVPPDSTGKKIGTVERTELHFDNLTGSFEVGDIVSGVTSNATGTVTAVVTEGFAANEGELYLKNVDGTFVDNESLQVSAVTQATSKLDVDPLATLNYQKVTIADPNNPEHIQKIDRFGATVNTFTDGAPTFSPFGAMTVGERQTIKDYVFRYSQRNDLFYTQTSGGGTSTYDAQAGVSLLSCGTASGDLVKRTTHFYHPYAPGVGQILQMTCRIGDTGKTNVRRRWGYYDDNNGVFWQLDGTQLSVVLRSNVTGSVVDTVINQEDFNTDKLDGSDNIGFNLDVSTPNIYWIDMQWLGAGRVRFGVFEPDGEQVVAHKIRNVNTPGINYPYMRTATLPFRYEQENTGAAGSTSEMRVACAAVKHSSEVKQDGVKHSQDAKLTISDTDGEIPFVGLRPKLQINGQPNKSLTKLVSLSITNACTVSDSPVIIRAYAGVDAMLTGSNWVTHSASSITEIDSAATAIAGAEQVFTFGVGANAAEFFQDLAPRDIHSIELNVHADSATQPFLYLTAEVPKPSSTCVLNAGVNWEEILE